MPLTQKNNPRNLFPAKLSVVTAELSPDNFFSNRDYRSSIEAESPVTLTLDGEKIKADGHGMDSNDGTFHTTYGKDGLHAEHSSNVEKCYIYIVFGNFTIYSAGDDMDSGYFLEINNGVLDICSGGGWEEAPVKVANASPMGDMMFGSMDKMGYMEDMMSIKEQMMGQMGGMPSMDMLPDDFELPEGFDMSNPDTEMLAQLPEEIQEM